MSIMSLKDLLKSNIPRAIIMMMVYVIAAIADTLNNYLLKYATDNLTKGNWNRAVLWLLIITGVGLLSFFLSPLATYLFNIQIQKYLHQIRARIMKQYYEQGTEQITEIENQLVNNLKVLTDNYANPWINILSMLLKVLMAITAMFTMHWSLVTATFLVTVVVLILPQILSKKLSESSAQAAEKNSILLNTIANWFSGLSELRRYHAKENLNQAINQSSQELANANIRQKKLEGTAEIINGIGNAIGQIGIGLWGAVLFFNHQVTIGDWLVSASFSSVIFNGLWEVISAMTKIKSTQKLRNQIAKSAEIVADKPKSIPVSGIQSHNLRIKYPHGETIIYPNFEIRKGEKVLLTGDSGTGKSTLFKVLLGQIEPTCGEVLYTNDKGQVVKPGEAHVGYIAQDASLFPDTIANNIMMFNQQLKSKLGDIIQKVQLAPDLAKLPAHADTLIDLDQNNLSGGQKQKVFLARAEIHDDEFLLLDEATSAIDREGVKQIINELLKTEATILLIAHNFSPDLKAKFDKQIHLTTNIKKGKENDN